jgi:hypothetical protein
MGDNRKILNKKKGKKRKAIPVTGREGPCETLRLSHFLDNRFTDGGKVVTLTRRLLFNPQEGSWYSFLLEAEATPGPWDSNPRPSGLQHSASTNYANACPEFKINIMQMHIKIQNQDRE